MEDRPWLASRGSAEDGVASGWTAGPEALQLFADAFDTADGDQASRLRSGLAQLLDTADDLGDRHGRAALIAAVGLIAVHPPETEAELNAVAAWCDALGRVGMSAEQAADVVLYLEDLFGRALNGWSLGWAVDLVLSLSRAPAVKQSDGVVNIFALFQSEALRRLQQLAPEVRESLHDLSIELDEELDDALLPAPATEDVLARLGPLVIAIHTLSISSAQAARDAIAIATPGTTVELNHDKRSTERLRALAKTADIFLFTSRSCQHAASDAIAAERPRDRPLIYVDGIGKSSILRALRLSLE